VPDFTSNPLSLRGNFWHVFAYQTHMQLFPLKKLKQMHDAFVKKNETISVAESVTAGLLQATLAQAEFASEFYQGGITCYNLGQKVKHLNVESIHAEKTNCVSEKVTAEMAISVCELFNSDWGIGITGYATPVPESKNKVFAYYAIAHKGKIVARKKLSAKKQEPFEVQTEYMHAVLNQLLKSLRFKA
jgi:PncC family amidohydrolase